MSVKPWRLLLLAATPAWEQLLRAQLSALGEDAYHLLTAPSWLAACERFALPANMLVLTCDLKAAELCPLPLILLLDEEPQSPPLSVVDWLVSSTLSSEVLRRCLRYASERTDLTDSLQRLAQQDGLTGLANRQGFHHVLANRLQEYQGHGLTLGHLDLDNFRHANDALGHQGGDRLIVQVVARIKAQLQTGDLLARLGSDEFALLIDSRRDPQRAMDVAERITQALSEPYWIDGESLLLGCSLGLAHSSAQMHADPLMWYAHIAMQQAKTQQGCTYRFYDQRVSRSARQQVELESELRRALRRNEFELHYQPRLCLQSDRIVGLEALVRWRHAEHGLLGPNEFVPLAEETGLIVPLGYWVINRALLDIQALLDQGLPPLHMAVNLSFRQFQDSQLLSTVSRLIKERGVDASWLEFELTETAVMRRSDHVQQTMLALEKLGVQFSLDDFGTGFSSFVHLHSLPINLLKIDRSFISGIAERAEDRQLVRAMINMAHNLNLKVVGEGVENPAQLALLRQYDCDQIQGYLISKALPLAELTRFLKQRQQYLQTQPIV